MANKLFLIAMFVSGGFLVSVHAQDANMASKKEVIEIKKDSLYLYGEGVADTDSVCEKLAEQRFMENLAQYVKSNPALASADVVTMPPIKKIMKRITFDRSVKRKVVFLYVKKSEIIPVLTGKMPEEPVATSLKKTNKPSFSVNTTGGTRATVTMQQQETTTEQPNNQSTTPKIATTSTPHGLNYQGLTIKEAEMLQEIVDRQTFECIKDYIVLRKSTKHDILFKATNDFNTISDSGYWIVFNKDRQLIAIVGKDKQTNLYNKEGVSLDDISTKAKIWLSIK